MRVRKQQYLHRRLVVSVFWTALVFAGLTSVLSFVAEYRRASVKTQTMLAQLLDTVEQTAAVAADAGNRAIAEDVLKGLLRNDIVLQARLRGRAGLDLQRRRGDAAAPAEVPPEIVRPLFSPSGAPDIIGTLAITPQAHISLREARDSAVIGAMNAAAIIGLTALILLAMIRSSLSRPLLTVSNTLHKIKVGEGVRLPPLPNHDGDELGQLVNDINALLDSAQEKFQEERRLLQQIQAVERQLRGIFDNTSAGIFLLDEHGRLRTANPTLARVLGLPDEAGADLAGCDFATLAFAEPDQFHDLLQLADAQKRTVAADLQLHSHVEGSAWVHCLLSRHHDSDGAVCFEGVAYDITERRALEMRVRHEADHDALTGLRRRQAFEREIQTLLDGASAQLRNAHVLMLLDLDNFKTINDTYGHTAGDAVLIEVAARLKRGVRGSDSVARLGGDEFVIVLQDCTPERACDIARNLVASVTQPIALNASTDGRVGISIGIAVHSLRTPTLADLLDAADMAMYEVKRQGKNGFGMVGEDGIITIEKVGDA